jgi:DNA (cytosine-5)-methyltransferase 1
MEETTSAMSAGLTPQVIDLFSGAGGLALGFRTAGCVIRAAVDADPMAGKSFLRNFTTLQPDCPPQVLAGPEHDLERVDLEQVSWPCRPDIVIGGPPCQAFSRVGRGKLDSLNEEGFAGDPRNQLYRKFLNAVALWEPRAMVMENVPGMLSVAGINYAEAVTGEMAELGYSTGYALLNAVWYGVPQFRERLFFIGIRKDLGTAPAAPPTTHHTILPEGYRRPLRTKEPVLPFGGLWNLIRGELMVPSAAATCPAITVREAIEDLPPLTDHLAGGPLLRADFRRLLAYPGEPHSDYARLMRSWPDFPTPDGVTDHVARRTPRDYGTFRLMRPGDRYPEALGIARHRFEEELARRQLSGSLPLPGTSAWKKIEAQFVPPYDEAEFPDKWRKLIPDQPSWTVPAHLAKDSYSHIHYDSAQARMISVREAARLQSFPDAFAFTGNMGDRFRQIGNAVPPLLAQAVAEAVLRVINM